MDNIEAVYLELSPRLPKLQPVMHTAWGMDELYVVDPDGNLIRFGQASAAGQWAGLLRTRPSIEPAGGRATQQCIDDVAHTGAELGAWGRPQVIVHPGWRIRLQQALKSPIGQWCTHHAQRELRDA